MEREKNRSSEKTQSQCLMCTVQGLEIHPYPEQDLCDLPPTFKPGELFSRLSRLRIFRFCRGTAAIADPTRRWQEDFCREREERNIDKDLKGERIHLASSNLKTLLLFPC